MTTLYRNVELVTRLVSAQFPGFTLYYGTGYWGGIAERNLTIEILAEPSAQVENGIRELARAIRSGLDQQAVLVVRIPCEHELPEVPDELTTGV